MTRLAPEVLAAGRVEWQLFLTLTWSGQLPRAEKRSRLARLFFRRLARKARVPFGDLVWFCREEDGEKTGRPHFHVLIAGLPSSVLGFEFGVIAGQLWEHGWLEGRLWVRGLGALEYSSEEGANIYEGKKFRAGLPIMLSESLARVVGCATGDDVLREDAEQLENPEVLFSGVESDAGLSQPDPQVMGCPTDGGYILAVNASRTTLDVWHRADITG